MKLGGVMSRFLMEHRREVTIPLPPGAPIITASPAHGVPIVAVEKWRREDKKRLVKRFQFTDEKQRNSFVLQLFSYETEKQHHADMKIGERFVELSISTKDMDSLTALDKEYAREADIVYRDIIYSPL